MRSCCLALGPLRRPAREQLLVAQTLDGRVLLGDPLLVPVAVPVPGAVVPVAVPVPGADVLPGVLLVGDGVGPVGGAPVDTLDVDLVGDVPPDPHPGGDVSRGADRFQRQPATADGDRDECQHRPAVVQQLPRRPPPVRVLTQQDDRREQRAGPEHQRPGGVERVGRELRAVGAGRGHHHHALAGSRRRRRQRDVDRRAGVEPDLARRTGRRTRSSRLRRPAARTSGTRVRPGRRAPTTPSPRHATTMPPIATTVGTSRRETARSRTIGPQTGAAAEGAHERATTRWRAAPTASARASSVRTSARAAHTGRLLSAGEASTPTAPSAAQPMVWCGRTTSSGIEAITIP